MISLLAERFAIIVAPAMACLVEGGQGTQRSSQISAAIAIELSLSSQMIISVPKGMSFCFSENVTESMRVSPIAEADVKFLTS